MSEGGTVKHKTRKLRASLGIHLEPMRGTVGHDQSFGGFSTPYTIRGRFYTAIDLVYSAGRNGTLSLSLSLCVTEEEELALSLT